MEIKIILPAKYIPIGSTVHKKTGTVKYILKDSISIYNNSVLVHKLKSDDGTLFMTSINGDINAIGKDTELIWCTDSDALSDYLEYQFEQFDTK